MKLYKVAPVCGVFFLAIVSLGCNKLKARDQLNKGVGSFRNAQFQAAIKHFQTAVDLDPTLLNARLYLATAYSQLYVPGGESQENVNVGKQAIAAFEDVLKTDPNNVTAIASIAQIYYNLKDFEKAKEYQRRRIQITPNDPEPNYWIGVIDWAVCYPRRMQLRTDLRLATPKVVNNVTVLPALPEKERAQLAARNSALVEEGINVLQKAIELRPNYEDAMAYLALMYREKADIEASAAAGDEDLKQADDWFQKAMNIKKQATEKAASAVR